ncbi:hypothetical protein L0U85_05240 [Glycomyces sp. L485]|uniref:hypothetical protein n=1 Tax=Glycomyces sp. L485 TaxID=2909235 RepID=UPI001F4BCDDB|nr:hypothetical protein [Glycomyces sp. L485]MCH7230262.1 hypothetical protein [Glycomyces sp. L485]
MPNYAPVPLPRYDGPDTSPTSVIAAVDEWIDSKPIRDLLGEFRGALPGGTAANLDYLESFTAEHWDFRAGRERFETDPERLDPRRERRVIEAATALGLGGLTAPRRERYTHVLVLGGLVSSCLFRTRFAAELLANGTAADRVTGIGGFRPFGEADTDFAEISGFTGSYEVDAMEVGLKRAFEIDGEPEIQREGDPDADPGRAWKVATYTADTATVQAVAAPSSEPGTRRADTVDTCRFWADRVAELAPGDSVLVVTSSLFVPFQHCEAVSHMGLPYECAVDTVGVDTASLPETHFRKEYTASGYLQETRSAIRSMRRLHDAVLRAEGTEPSHD